MSLRTKVQSRVIEVLITAALAASVPAFAAETHQFNVPAEDAPDAIRDFASQARVQILVADEHVKDKRLPGVKGEYSTDQGLHILLADSGLAPQYVGDRSIALVAQAQASTPPTSDQQKEGKKSSSDQFRVAQADQGVPAQSSSVETEKNRPVVLEEVVVTGTHIRGEEPVGSKLLTITREDIAESGYGRVEDVLATLSQNFPGVNEAAGQTTSFAGNDNRGAEVQLRGIGVGTTLTLVNGHRQPAGGLNGAFVDISSLPVSAIERIEILPDGASAIYGSDAIGGVVNFILRKEYSGAETRVRLGTADGTAGETQASQLFGTTWSSGSVLVGYQYYKRDSLPCIDRAYCASNNDFTSRGGSDFRDVFGQPGNILDPNTGNPAYAIPKGQDGTHLTTAQLLPGVVNYTDYVSQADVLPEQRVNSGFFNATQEVGDSVELFADGRVSSRRMEFAGSTGVQRDLRVPSTNPFYVNPFGGSGPVTVAYDFAKDLGKIDREGTINTYAVALGAVSHLSADWQLTLTGTYGKEENINTLDNLTFGALIRPHLADPNPATAFNVFGDGSHTNPATLAAMRATQTFHGVADEGSVGAIADGPLVALPAGNVKLALGADYRNETLDANGYETAPSIATINNYAGRSSRHVAAAFSELTIPLIGPSDKLNKGGSLELSLAGRYEDYSDFGRTFNPKVGLSWSPWQWVTLRGTWGTSFRAPPFYATNLGINPPGGGTAIVTDPKSPTGLSKVIEVFGNNPDLKQETAHVWTAGFDLHPVAVPGFNLSLTYFDIDYRDKIASFLGDASTVLQNEAIYGPIITRNPTQAQIDQICNMPGFSGDCTGAISAIIDGRQLNVAVVKMRGLDAELKYSMTTNHGTLGWSLAGTYTFNDYQAVTTTAPIVDVIDTVGNPLALRLRSKLSWSTHSWSSSATLNHTGAYRNPGATPDTVGSYTTVDLNFAYRSPRNTGSLGHTQLFVSAVNVLNRSPPFVNQPGGYDTANFTLLGRILSIEVVKGW